MQRSKIANEIVENAVAAGVLARFFSADGVTGLAGATPV